MQDVCGIIVSYNPTDLIMDIITNSCLALDSTIIMDNSIDSSLFYKLESMLEDLKTKHPEKNLIIIKNDSNLGLPKSYNKAVSLAIEMNFHSVLLLDQDSLISEDSITILLDDRKKLLSLGVKVGAIGMYHDQSNYLHNPVGSLFNDKMRWRKMLYSDCVEERRMLINSGMLISIENYKSVEGYNETFFMDNSDLEFSLRLRKKGLRLFESRKSRMLHNYDERNNKTFLFALPYRAPNREYYARDLIRCMKIAKSVSWIDYFLIILLVLSKITGTLLFKTDKKERFHYIFSGLKDGLKEDAGQDPV